MQIPNITKLLNTLRAIIILSYSCQCSFSLVIDAFNWVVLYDQVPIISLKSWQNQASIY